MAQSPHVFLVTLPSQGHINPSLQLAKRFARMGLQVTFATTVYAYRHISKAPNVLIKGLNFASFSDGYDDGYKLNPSDATQYMTELKNRGTRALRDIILSFADQGRPVTSLVYSILLPWCADLACELHIPSALLWTQPATVLDIYYYYFNGYKDEISGNGNGNGDGDGGGRNWTIQLPGLPLLSSNDLPSFIVRSGPVTYSFALPCFKEQLDKLDAEEKATVLVNTFDALEPEALKIIEKYNMIGVGPLIPSAFLDGKDPSDTSPGGDLFEKSIDYIEWLNSKPESSVVYISFGSLLILPKNQMEEIARGLLETGRPFLWVIRENQNGEEKLSCMEELEQQGRMVPWCRQLEVLIHPSLGCFMTHCGWNSTLESLTCGVPLVAFPQWTDQATNAKLIQDVWKAGIRVTTKEDGRAESDEIKRCIEMVMDGGEKSLEVRRNAKKWKDLARESMEEGGSSHKNLQSFVEEIEKMSK